jgi:hypothetical protein
MLHSIRMHCLLLRECLHVTYFLVNTIVIRLSLSYAFAVSSIVVLNLDIFKNFQCYNQIKKVENLEKLNKIQVIVT